MGLFQNVLRSLVKSFSVFGEGDAVSTVSEKAQVKFLFQLADGCGDRGLGDKESIGSSCDAVVAADRTEVF